MKATPIIITAIALVHSGSAHATEGFLQTCSNFTLRNLNGVKGRSPILTATCKTIDQNTNWSELNLNNCLGWSAVDCSFIFPPSGGFTDSVTGCNNTFYGGDEHFGENFGCYGPCVDSDPDEYYDVFVLNSVIGNTDGSLSC